LALNNTGTGHRKPSISHHVRLCPDLADTGVWHCIIIYADYCNSLWTVTNRDWRYSRFLCCAAIFPRAGPRCLGSRVIDRYDQARTSVIDESLEEQESISATRTSVLIERMHRHMAPQNQAPQTPLGQAASFATTTGLLLLVPPQQILYDTCPVCGHQQPAGGRFCGNCGIRLRCPSCGTTSLGKNYCHMCGQALKP
jgi:double zinc ribbon protein